MLVRQPLLIHECLQLEVVLRPGVSCENVAHHPGDRSANQQNQDYRCCQRRTQKVAFTDFHGHGLPFSL
jgi:hypothetical protein